MFSFMFVAFPFDIMCALPRGPVRRARDLGVLPQPKSTTEGVDVVAGAATLRQLFQFVNVPAAQHDVLGFERRDQPLYNIFDIAPPLFFAVLLESPNPNVVLEGGLPVRQVSQLHGLDGAVHDHGRAEASAQAQKKHLASLVTPQGLHCSIVYDLDRPLESSFKVEPYPALSQVPWFGNWPVPKDRPRVTDGNGVILPVGGQLPHFRGHPLWG
jgi:hypothetical protein